MMYEYINIFMDSSANASIVHIQHKIILQKEKLPRTNGPSWIDLYQQHVRPKLN